MTQSEHTHALSDKNDYDNAGLSMKKRTCDYQPNMDDFW